jgi:peptide subunit release factor 1 (eRF1)
MFKKYPIILLSIVVLLSSCASVPMASLKDDAKAKEFLNPANDKSGIYIYRNTFVGQALKKNVFIDRLLVGETANKVYFYKKITPGKHIISTESEFSDNKIELVTKGGINYFIEQYIKMGVFVGGANLKIISEAEGKKAVLECQLAK